MNRRLLVRSGLACAGLCLAAWRLPPLLDGTLSTIDQHRGAISMLRGEGHIIHDADGAAAPARDEVQVLGVAGSLSAAERAKLLEAARRKDPLAEAEAKVAARRPSTAKSPAPAQPAANPTPPLDPALAAAMRALGMDPSTMDLSTLDVDALLTQARGKTPKD